MIQREHKSQYYNNENLRHLQRQINELWEVVDRRVEDVKTEEFAGPMPCQHTARERLEMAKEAKLKGVKVVHFLTTDEDEKEVSWEEYVAGMEKEIIAEETGDVEEPRTLTQEEIEGMTGITEAMKGCPSPVLNPQPFKVVPTGRGWYQVVDSEGKPVHEGKLRRDAADEACKKAMQSAA